MSTCGCADARLCVCSTLDVVAENQTEWEAWIMALAALLPCQPEFGTYGFALLFSSARYVLCVLLAL